MKYLAHTENTNGKVHDLDDHLKCVGELAEGAGDRVFHLPSAMCAENLLKIIKNFF